MYLINYFSEKLRKIEEICLVCGRLFICYGESGFADEARFHSDKTAFTVVETPAFSLTSFFGLPWLDEKIMSILRVVLSGRHQSQLTNRSKGDGLRPLLTNDRYCALYKKLRRNIRISARSWPPAARANIRPTELRLRSWCQ